MNIGKSKGSLIQELMQRKLRVSSGIRPPNAKVRMSRAGMTENQPTFKPLADGPHQPSLIPKIKGF